MKTAVFSLLFILLNVVCSPAQTPPAAAKRIAFITQPRFCFESSGIKDLAKAIAKLKSLTGETLCYPPDWPEIFQLEESLKDQNLSAGDKQQKELRLKRLISQRGEYVNTETYRKPERELVGPIIIEIENLLKKIAAENNLILIEPYKYDGTGQLIGLNRKAEITWQFIDHFNDKRGKPFKLNIATGKIAVIDTKRFPDQQNGLSIFANDPSITPENACAKPGVCREIGNAIEAYTLKRGFIVVFDSSKPMPPGIGSDVVDITQEFISDYNNNYKNNRRN